MGINLGKPAGAGVLDHVHLHVVPRWNGDTNYMTVVGDDARAAGRTAEERERVCEPIFAELDSAAASQRLSWIFRPTASQIGSRLMTGRDTDFEL